MSDNPSLLALLLIGPGGGAALYWALYRYYRNTDKSHAFERETAVEAKPVTGSDRKVGVNTGTQQKHIRDNNVQAYRSRVERIKSKGEIECLATRQLGATGKDSRQDADATASTAAPKQDAYAVKQLVTLPCPRCGSRIALATKVPGVSVACGSCGARFKTRKKNNA